MRNILAIAYFVTLYMYIKSLGQIDFGLYIILKMHHLMQELNLLEMSDYQKDCTFKDSHAQIT